MTAYVVSPTDRKMTERIVSVHTYPKTQVDQKRDGVRAEAPIELSRLVCHGKYRHGVSSSTMRGRMDGYVVNSIHERDTRFLFLTRHFGRLDLCSTCRTCAG